LFIYQLFDLSILFGYSLYKVDFV